MKHPDSVLKIPLLGSEARKGPPGSASPATSSQALQTCGHIIHQSTSRLTKHFMRSEWNLQPSEGDQGQRYKAYKRARETEDLTKVPSQHEIFYTKGHSSTANPHHPWSKDRQKINLLVPKKEFWNKLYTTHIIIHRGPLPTNHIPQGSSISARYTAPGHNRVTSKRQQWAKSPPDITLSTVHMMRLKD